MSEVAEENEVRRGRKPDDQFWSGFWCGIFVGFMIIVAIGILLV